MRRLRPAASAVVLLAVLASGCGGGEASDTPSVWAGPDAPGAERATDAPDPAEPEIPPQDVTTTAPLPVVADEFALYLADFLVVVADLIDEQGDPRVADDPHALAGAWERAGQRVAVLPPTLELLTMHQDWLAMADGYRSAFVALGDAARSGAGVEQAIIDFDTRVTALQSEALEIDAVLFASVREVLATRTDAHAEYLRRITAVAEETAPILEQMVVAIDRALVDPVHGIPHMEQSLDAVGEVRDRWAEVTPDQASAAVHADQVQHLSDFILAYDALTTDLELGRRPSPGVVADVIRLARDSMGIGADVNRLTADALDGDRA